MNANPAPPEAPVAKLAQVVGTTVESPDRPTTLTDLPDELLLKVVQIVRKLSTRQMLIYRLMRACKRFSEILVSELYKDLVVRTFQLAQPSSRQKDPWRPF